MCMPIRRKYTQKILENAVKESTSVRQVVIKVGGNVLSGSTATYISKLIKSYNIDTDHFTGQASNKGKSFNKRTLDQIFVKRPQELGRETGRTLRNALIKDDRNYKCEECNLLPTWNHKILLLQVDHINGDGSDNRRENIRFLCPNCHSQTETHSKRKRPNR